MKNSHPLLSLLVPVVFLAFALQMQAQSDRYLHFDGINDYARLDNGSQYIANASGLTMAGWFYTDQLVYGQGMMGFRGNNGFYLIQLSDGIIECRFHNSTGFYEYVAPAFSIVPEVWQHIAWVYDGTKVALYIDGVLKGSTPASGTFEISNVPFAIGRSILSGFDFYYGGRVDEVSVWTRALSAEEIQQMMADELMGNENGLQLYYKFNQGVPGEDNTSITKLKSETGAGERDADLLNFAMNGSTSNFNGTLDVGFQAITFPLIPNKLIGDPPFSLEASASSGLPVSYEVVYGPATVQGNEVTLTGQPGEVAIRASQPGDDVYDPAEDLVNTFQVLDPDTHVPDIDARNPLQGDVFVPQLSAIQLAAISTIDYPELFSVQHVKFEVNGEIIDATDWGNGHYTAWWTPPAYGNYALKIMSGNNYGASATETLNINIVEDVPDINDVIASQDVWLNSTTNVQIVEAELPSFLGAFEEIVATLQVTCPPGGCGEWDRVSWIEAKGHDGQWVEIFRYITPYGTACSHSIDLTDYNSILQGKIAFRLYNGTLDNGYLYNLSFDYKAGTPEFKYSTITKLWYDTYQFGDPANLQPCETYHVAYPAEALASKLKLVSTGHGWGSNNSGNAAEFHEDTHHIWIDGQQAFAQHNWKDCNPNPDGCQPQAGTWFYDRAGWCPGAIAPWFDFNMTPFVGPGSLELKYIFDEDYIDNCHPNNPNCISGVTCPDCSDGFNPHLVVATNLITYADQPIDGSVITGTGREPESLDAICTLFPNPSSGIFNLILNKPVNKLEVRVVNGFGQRVAAYRWDNPSDVQIINLEELPAGIYYIEIQTETGRDLKKIIKR